MKTIVTKFNLTKRMLKTLEADLTIISPHFPANEQV